MLWKTLVYFDKVFVREMTANRNYVDVTFGLVRNLPKVLRKAKGHCVYRHTHKHKHIYYLLTGIQPLGRSGQRPEFSQATGIALVRCILGKFLGVACHCFPPRLDVPTFHHQVPPRPPRREISQRRKWELWARMLSGNFA